MARHLFVNVSFSQNYYTDVIYVLLNFTSSLIVLYYSTCETIIAEISLPHGSDYDTFIWSTFRVLMISYNILSTFLQLSFHFYTHKKSATFIQKTNHFLATHLPLTCNILTTLHTSHLPLSCNILTTLHTTHLPLTSNILTTLHTTNLILSCKIRTSFLKHIYHFPAMYLPFYCNIPLPYN